MTVNGKSVVSLRTLWLLAGLCSWTMAQEATKPARIPGLPEIEVPAATRMPEAPAAATPDPQGTSAATAPAAPVLSVVPEARVPAKPPAPGDATATSLPLGETSSLALEPEFIELERWSNTMTREDFEAAVSEIYSDGSPLPPPWRIEGDSLVIQTGMQSQPTVRIKFQDKHDKPAEVSRTWRRGSDLPPLDGRPPLSDVHIALDPGHIGGGWARMEERFLSFKEGEAVQEGDLTLMTAKILMGRLRELGAYVSLVRESLNPVTEDRPDDLRSVAKDILRKAGLSFPEDSYAGIQGDAKVLTVQWQAEKLFYRVSEIRARAQKVNEEIKPDVVICLHLNAEGWGKADAPQFSPKNHLHVLVNGCYAPVELANQDVRFEMLNRLFGRIHEEEIPLAQSMAEALAKTTDLPAYVYTTPNARPAGLSSYVYARNLLANRLYMCPVVYLEPFVMNHEETYHRLLMGHYLGRTLFNGKLRTSAIEDYVRGVVQGLLGYYAKQRPHS